MNLQDVDVPTPWQGEEEMSPLTQMENSPPLPSTIPVPINRTSMVMHTSTTQNGAPFITMKIWTRALQEQQNAHAKRRTQCSMYPVIWKNLAVCCQVQWKQDGWAYFQKKNPNLSDFKSRLTKWIVMQRKQTLLSDIISEYQDHSFAAALPENIARGPVIYYLSYSQFVKWASDTFKTDQMQLTEHLKPTVNDRIRLTSIMGLQDNRDHVIKLG